MHPVGVAEVAAGGQSAVGSDVLYAPTALEPALPVGQSSVPAWLDRLAGAPDRVAISLVVVLAVAVVALVVLPRVIARMRGFVATPARDRVARATSAAVGRAVPTSAGGFALRTAQIALVLAAGLVLLALWDRLDWAVATGEAALDLVPDLARGTVTVLLAIVAAVGSDWLRRGVDQLGEQTEQLTEHQEEILLRVAQLTLFVAVAAAMLTMWGVDLTGLLVGAGFLGIVVGLAARQTLGSLLAGFLMMFSRPFTIGDWVVVDDEEGIVTGITIFTTRLENLDGEVVVLPNDLVSQQPIVNRTRTGRLRLHTAVGIDYDVTIERAVAVAREAIESVAVVAEDPEPRVVPSEFADSEVVLDCYYWIRTPTPERRWDAVGSVVTAIENAFDAENVRIPFPQQELSSRNEISEPATADGDDDTESENGGAATGDGSDDNESENGGAATGDGSDDNGGEDGQAGTADGDGNEADTDGDVREGGESDPDRDA